MDWFLYDNDLHHERVNVYNFCLNRERTEIGDGVMQLCVMILKGRTITIRPPNVSCTPPENVMVVT